MHARAETKQFAIAKSIIMDVRLLPVSNVLIEFNDGLRDIHVYQVEKNMMTQFGAHIMRVELHRY